jgi:hypothetical protein
MAHAEDSVKVNSEDRLARVAVKIPPMWKNNITVWFVQVEANFDVANITSDLTKYNYLLTAIDTDTLSAITDVIIKPPEIDKYQTLKKRIIEEFSDTQSQQIRKLLSDLTLGDRKPSVLLRQMRELAKDSVTKEFLKTIWLERLPTQTQAILSVSSAELTELATLADKIHEIRPEPTVYALAKNQDTERDEKSDAIVELRKEMQQLRIQIAELSSATEKRTKFRSGDRFREKSNSRRGVSRTPEGKQTEVGYCFYHKKFGRQAYKCREPCSFEENEKN